MGANKKRFLVTKEMTTVDRAKMVEQVRNAEPGLMARIAKVLKSFTGKPEEGGKDKAESVLAELSLPAQTAVKAVGRIIGPHKDEITDDHLDAIQEAVGIGAGTHDEGSEGTGGDEDVKPEHMESGKEAMKKAYKEHMSKLGYAKYPEPEFTMKSGKKNPASEEADTTSAHDDDDEEGDDVSKTAQPITKEDGSLNLEAVPAEMRPALEVIAKAQVAAESRAKDAVAKLETVTKELDATKATLSETRASTRRAEIVAKAASFKNLAQEDVVKTLSLADKDSPAEFERVTKMFESQDALIAQGNVFKELGSGHTGSSGSMDAWAKIEKSAEGIVQKSTTPITKAQAIDQFIQTTEGRALYQQHQASRKDGI